VSPSEYAGFLFHDVSKGALTAQLFGAWFGAYFMPLKIRAPKMPKLISPLTDIQLRNAKPAEKPYKLSDGGGMYVEVMPNGSKFWRMKVRQANGKESRLTFGSYPEMTLAGARAKRSTVKKQQADGLDPAQSKRIEKLQKRAAAVNTFEVLAREWHANKAATWKENTAKEALARLENDVFPRIGKSPIADLEAPMVLDVLYQIEKRGAVDMAARVAAHCSSVFRFTIAKGIVKYNPIPDLRGALKPRVRVNRQLAHGSNDEYGEAYDREQFQDERKVMMQAYADYLDPVEGGGNVIPVSFRRA
jgi:hypothetical protein